MRMEKLTLGHTEACPGPAAILKLWDPLLLLPPNFDVPSVPEMAV